MGAVGRTGPSTAGWITPSGIPRDVSTSTNTDKVLAEACCWNISAIQPASTIGLLISIVCTGAGRNAISTFIAKE